MTTSSFRMGALVFATAICASSLPASAAGLQPSPLQEGSSCRLGHVDASITNSVRPDMPEMARMTGATGSTTVRVDLDDRGVVQNVSVAASSGNIFLDKAALDAVRQSSFAPEQNNCVATAGSYSVVVDFTP